MLTTRSSDSDAAPEAGLAAAAGLFFAVQGMIPLVGVDVLGMDAQAGSAIRLFLTFALLVLVALMSVAGPAAEARHDRMLAPIRWTVCFLVLSGCSFLWSEAASPMTSSLYWVGTACDLGLVMVLLRGADRQHRAESLMTGFVVGALIVAAAAWLMPAQPDLRLGDEAYFNSNTIAYICSFAVFFAQYFMGRRGGKWIWIVLLLVATIFRSLSKTTIVAFLCGEAYLLARDRSIERRTKWVIAMSGVVLLIAFSGLFAKYFIVYTSYGNQAETLTGRTAIWAWALSEGMQRPWLGHGFDAMWKVAPVFGTFEARHAENEVLQQFYAFGAAGVVVLLGVYRSLWRVVQRGTREPRRAVFAAVIVFVVVRGLAEAEPFDLLLPLWMIALIATVVASKESEMSAVGAAVSTRTLKVQNVTTL